jgi:hypothetical protein
MASGFMAAALSVAPTNGNKTTLPVLHGDGATDDTAALSALLNGQRVMHQGRVIQAHGKAVHMPPGVFRVESGTIPFAPNVHIIGAPDFTTAFTSRISKGQVTHE